MTQQSIPIQPVPAQTVSVTLGSQPCAITIYQKSTGLFLDLAVNDAPIVTGVLCHNLVKIVRDAYLGFTGDLAFLDTQGTDDPTYDGLGGRYLLLYLS